MAETISASDAIELMNPALRACYSQVSEFMTGVNQNNITARHKTGDAVADVLNSDDPEKYGKKAAATLATALDIPKQELYRCKVFAETYTAGQVGKLVKRKTTAGRRITWSHLDALIRIPKAETRDALLERVFKEDLNTRALHNLIKQKLGKRGNGKGRPKAAPKTLEGAIAVLERQTKALNELYLVVKEKVDAAIDQPADSVFENYEAAIGDTSAQCKAAAEVLKDVQSLLRSVQTAFAKIGRLKKNQDEFVDQEDEPASKPKPGKKVVLKLRRVA